MRAVLAVCLAACGYSPAPAGGPGIDAVGVDVPPDQMAVCSPNAKICSGRKLQTCSADGLSVVSETVCPLSCDADHCTVASNLEAAMQVACDATAPSYTAANNARIAGDLDLECDGCTSIPVTQRFEMGAIDLAYYCLSHFEIPNGQTFDASFNSSAAILIFVAGDVVIDDRLDLRGNFSTPGAGGFSGAQSAGNNAGPGQIGFGPCPGGGGESTPEPGGTLQVGDNVGGGGGGAGGLSTGELGGNGRDNGNNVANGGGAGIFGTACSNVNLVPLVGGSGGGGGGDGACSGGSGACGRSGGGGGGAIQIVATGTITIGTQGSIDATGGTGGFNTGNQSPGGGGGGGGGGSVLLEAPALAITGGILVDGGSGGETAGHAGGAGGTKASLPVPGQNFAANGQGGSGAGGSQGRVRLNAKTGATCATAAVDPCTSAGLTLAP